MQSSAGAHHILGMRPVACGRARWACAHAVAAPAARGGCECCCFTFRVAMQRILHASCPCCQASPTSAVTAFSRIPACVFSAPASHAGAQLMPHIASCSSCGTRSCRCTWAPVAHDMRALRPCIALLLRCRRASHAHRLACMRLQRLPPPMRPSRFVLLSWGYPITSAARAHVITYMSHF